MDYMASARAHIRDDRKTIMIFFFFCFRGGGVTLMLLLKVAHAHSNNVNNGDNPALQILRGYPPPSQRLLQGTFEII